MSASVAAQISDLGRLQLTLSDRPIGPGRGSKARLCRLAGRANLNRSAGRSATGRTSRHDPAAIGAWHHPGVRHRRDGPGLCGPGNRAGMPGPTAPDVGRSDLAHWAARLSPAMPAQVLQTWPFRRLPTAPAGASPGRDQARTATGACPQSRPVNGTGSKPCRSSPVLLTRGHAGVGQQPVQAWRPAQPAAPARAGHRDW